MRYNGRMAIAVDVPRDELAALCQRYHVRRLMLFGSVLRDDFRPDSDVDVLVEFEPDARIGFFKFVDLEDSLSELLGRKVDLNTPESLSRHFRHKAIQTARVMYERTG